MKDIDAIDRRILVHLDTDARQSLSDLARKVRRGRDIVAYRFSRLVDLGIILGARAIIDPAAFGLTVFKWYVKLRSRGPKLRRLFKCLDAHPAVSCYASCAGQWDVMINIFAVNPSDFRSTVTLLTEENPDCIHETAFSIIIHYDWYVRSHLARESITRLITTTHREREKVELDGAALKVAAALVLNPRGSVSKIAETLRLPEHVVRHRLELVEGVGVIPRYRLIVDRKALGYSVFKVLCGAIHPTSEELAEFKNDCYKEQVIVSVIEQIGRHNIEFNIEAPDYDSADRIIQKLEVKHPKFFDGATVLILRDEAFRSTLPLVAPRRTKAKPDMGAMM